MEKWTFVIRNVDIVIKKSSIFNINSTIFNILLESYFEYVNILIIMSKFIQENI